MERAEALGYQPLLAELARARADAASSRGEIDDLLAWDERAFELGLASRHDLTAMQAAGDMVYTNGVTRHELEPAKAWARRADALHQRIGGTDELRIPTLNALASSYGLAGRDEEALALYEEALGIANEVGKPYLRATVINNMGAFHAERRRLGEARKYLEQAAELNEEIYGPDHPNSLRTRSNLGILTVLDGHFAEGLAMLEDVVPKQARLMGSDHPEVANTMENLASAVTRAGDLARAEQLRRQVLEIRMRAFEPRSAPVVAAKTNLASLLLFIDQPAEARTLLLDLDDGEIDPRHHVQVLLGLTGASRRLGSLDDALTYASRSIALCKESDSCEPQVSSAVQSAMGEVRLERGELEEARVAFESALEGPPLDFSPWTGPSARFGLAQALVAKDREQALAQARQALEDIEGHQDFNSKKLRADIEAWLKSHED